MQIETDNLFFSFTPSLSPSCPLQQLINCVPQLLIIEFDEIGLESLCHLWLDQINFRQIQFILLEVLHWKTKSFFPETADMLIVVGDISFGDLFSKDSFDEDSEVSDTNGNFNLVRWDWVAWLAESILEQGWQNIRHNLERGVGSVSLVAFFNTKLENLDHLGIELLFKHQAVAEELLSLLGSYQFHVESEQRLQGFQNSDCKGSCKEFFLWSHAHLKHVFNDAHVIRQEGKHFLR